MCNCHYADHIILYIENPNIFTKKLLELIRDFSKVAGYKINRQKSVVFLYANNGISENKKAIAFIMTLKNKIGINLAKEVKYIYSENCTTLMMKVKDDTTMDKVLLDLKN